MRNFREHVCVRLCACVYARIRIRLCAFVHDVTYLPTLELIFRLRLHHVHEVVEDRRVRGDTYTPSHQYHYLVPVPILVTRPVRTVYVNLYRCRGWVGLGLGGVVRWWSERLTLGWLIEVIVPSRIPVASLLRPRVHSPHFYS